MGGLFKDREPPYPYEWDLLRNLHEVRDVGVVLGRPVWSPLSSPPNVEEKCGTRKKSMETWRQYLESFQKLPESFQELPESFREWFVNGL